MTNEPIFLFSNPHSHHSFFSYLALRGIGKTILLCPPLQIEFLTRKWSGLYFAFSEVPLIMCGQLLCIVSFILYKARLLQEKLYINCLSYVTDKIILNCENVVWLHYQDYIQISNKCRTMLKLDVCELIISTCPEVANWKSTINAVSCADIVTYPSSNLTSLSTDLMSKSFLVPYGGNKSQYRTQVSASYSPSPPRLICSRVINIAARANTIRKGLDILTESLILINSRLDFECFGAINVFICGAVTEPSARNLLDVATNELRRSGIIKISSKQYTQSAYLDLLRSSDLFVMPSRLEGSSPAALEALWLGTPSILSHACGIDQFKNDQHGILLAKTTPQSLCEALHAVIQNPLRLSAWRACLKKDNDLYKWDAYLASYRSILVKSLDHT